MTHTLEQRREHERSKYLELAKGSYGSTNHGSAAEAMIAGWNPSMIVDFGCGKNNFITNMRKRGIDGTGIDFAMPEADIVAPMHQVPIEANTADVVTSFDALEHLLPADVDMALAEMHRVGKPGGRFVFSIATTPSRITVNGQNLHPTVRPLKWWLEKLKMLGTVEQTGRYIVGTWKAEPTTAAARQISHHGASALAPSHRRLLLYTNTLESVSLQNWYAGKSLFLICSGPSLKTMDLTQLNRRGIVTMAVNNAWAVHRPNLWTCFDPAGKFHDLGWKDPGITKFIGLAQRDARLRVRRDDGTFRSSRFTVADMPATFFFPTRTHFDAATFFHDSAIQGGNEAKVKDAQGLPGGRSVMFPALRLAQYLGFRTVFLLGADFKMAPDRKYAFDQERLPSAIDHNNRLYRVLNQRFAVLKARHFKALDFHVFNCAPKGESDLTAFPHWPYEKALEYAQQECGRRMITDGWYDPPPAPPKTPSAPASAKPKRGCGCGKKRRQEAGR